MRGVRDAVFEAALRRGVFVMGEYADTMATIARHSTMTAYITRIVCRRAAIDQDAAFICGLLHDVGFAGLLLAVTHFEGRTRRRCRSFGKTSTRFTSGPGDSLDLFDVESACAELSIDDTALSSSPTPSARCPKSFCSRRAGASTSLALVRARRCALPAAPRPAVSH